MEKDTPPSSKLDMQALGKAWIALHAKQSGKGDDENFWAVEQLSGLCDAYPDLCWQTINEIRRLDGSEKILANLAAGPLEDLLVRHGRKYFDAIERLARTDPQFRKMLGGVWRNSIADDIWTRIAAVAGPTF